MGANRPTFWSFTLKPSIFFGFIQPIGLLELLSPHPPFFGPRTELEEGSFWAGFSPCAVFFFSVEDPGVKDWRMVKTPPNQRRSCDLKWVCLKKGAQNAQNVMACHPRIISRIIKQGRMSQAAARYCLKSALTPENSPTLRDSNLRLRWIRIYWWVLLCLRCSMGSIGGKWWTDNTDNMRIGSLKSLCLKMGR